MILKQGHIYRSIPHDGKRIAYIYRGGRCYYIASPYSPEATQALKAAFPQYWTAIRDYGYAHPQLVPFINEDPMLIVSLVEVGKVRYACGVDGYWDTGVQVTRQNWNTIRYVLDARPTLANVGNKWWANGVGGGAVCCLHVGINNGTTNYNNAPFTYANGYSDITTKSYGQIGKRYRWDFDLPNTSYKVYDEYGNIVCNEVAQLKAPTADNTSGGITVGKWHQYNNINTGYTSSIDTKECLMYLSGELAHHFVPYRDPSTGEMELLDLVTLTLATRVGTFTEIIEDKQ